MKKFLLTIALVLVAATPSWAVFNEKNLTQTLQVLRYELCRSYSEMSRNQKNFMMRDESQHQELMALMKSCNELSLMLYSQKQDFTFDLTYALQQVTDQYYDFTRKRMPFDQIINYMNTEIDRYQRLINALRMLPPALGAVPDSISTGYLDSLAFSIRHHSMPSPTFMPGGPQPDFRPGHDSPAPPLAPNPPARPRDTVAGKDSIAADSLMNNGASVDSVQKDSLAGPRKEWHKHKAFALDTLSLKDRDSCVFYASQILSMLIDARDHIVEDNQNYQETDARLKSFFDYAQKRYSLVQKTIFRGQDNYLRVLTHLKQYTSRAFNDASDKYGRAYFTDVQSEWRGPMVVGFTFMVIFYLIIASLLSNIVVRILMKRVKRFQSVEFRKRSFAWIIFAAMIIFVVVLAIASATSKNSNFFRMASSLLIEYLVMVIIIQASMNIRLDGSQIDNGLLLIAPVLLLGLIVMTFRIIFIPNSLATLIFPPILLLFCIWQMASVKRNPEGAPRIDRELASVSIFITFVVLAMSVAGYVILSLQVYIWWIFQLAALYLVAACKYLVDKYHTSRVEPRIKAYKLSHKNFSYAKKESLVAVTWLYDLLDMVLVPLMVLISIPLCLYMSSQVFDLTSLCMKFFFTPFINASFLHISVAKLLVVTGLYFIFKYICFASKGFYRLYKFRSVMTKTGNDFVHENDVNLTLAYNVIGIVVWGIYVIATIIILNIPTKSLSVVTAGLAAGIGFAMKDVLNNFFYGVQLMSGRLRVGDYIECDGVRGKVDNIDYQSTQIVSIEGAVMAFPNSSLFNKNFKNLTRNHSYEYIAIPVGVAYGTDINHVRQILTEALSPLCKPDKFGRDVVEPKYGIKVTLSDFGSSSVDLTVKQFVLVDEHYNFIEKANEIIYNTLNNNGVEIPFPQQDIYIKNVLSELKK